LKDPVGSLPSSFTIIFSGFPPNSFELSFRGIKGVITSPREIFEAAFETGSNA
jgi:hypothetical protein